MLILNILTYFWRIWRNEINLQNKRGKNPPTHTLINEPEHLGTVAPFVLSYGHNSQNNFAFLHICIPLIVVIRVIMTKRR